MHYVIFIIYYQFYNYQLVLIIKIKENIWTIASVTRTTNTISKEKITWNMIWLINLKNTIKYSYFFLMLIEIFIVIRNFIIRNKL